LTQYTHQEAFEIRVNDGGAPRSRADGTCEAPPHEDGDRKLIRPLSWIRIPFIPAAKLRSIMDK